MEKNNIDGVGLLAQAEEEITKFTKLYHTAIGNANRARIDEVNSEIKYRQLKAIKIKEAREKNIPATLISDLIYDDDVMLETFKARLLTEAQRKNAEAIQEFYRDAVYSKRALLKADITL